MVSCQRKLTEYPESSKRITELWKRVQAEWKKIEVGQCQELIESMPRRVQEVIKAKGGYTSYWFCISDIPATKLLQ